MSLDPRHASAEKIIPPFPLPHVSRKALRRVKNPLPAPTECRHCQGPVDLVGNEAVYGRQYGKWPYLYRCVQCDAFVGLHPDTDIPLGTLAKKDLREARKSAKALFHEVQARKGWSRNQSYAWLATRTSTPPEECHFGWFDMLACLRAKKACSLLIDFQEAELKALADEVERMIDDGSIKL